MLTSFLCTKKTWATMQFNDLIIHISWLSHSDDDIDNQINPLSTMYSVLEFLRYIKNKSYWDQTCTSRKAKGQFTSVSQNKLWRLAKKFLTIFELFLEVNNLLSSTRIIIITNKDFITLEIFQMHDKSGHCM